MKYTISHRIVYSVIFYLLVILLIFVAKPPLMFENGNIKPFGIGDNKTVVSVGVLSVSLAILSFYLFAVIDIVFKNK